MKFTVDNLPRPVVTQELDYQAAKDLRLGDYVARMLDEGIEYDVDMIEADPAVIGAGSAAMGDTQFVARLNDAARVALLAYFATGSDLDLHADREGLERLPGEEDPQLYERIRLARKGKSAAGPDDYYKEKARRTDVRVRDVAVYAETRNASQRVLILSILTNDNGGLMTPDLADKLTVALNDPAFRSRNVTVEVVPALLTTKPVTGTLYLYPDTPDVVVDEAETELINAVDRDQRLGFDLTDSYVKRALHQPGVQRVELSGWSDALAAFNEAVRLGAVDLTPVRLSS